jgi:D-aminoacyl-tRNA deacylase
VRLVLQRVSSASVSVGGVVVGAIERGMLVLVGFAPADTREDLVRAVDKVGSLRVFADRDGFMNMSLADVGGTLLVVSQFTLLGDVRRGRRPSFSGSADPELASALFDEFIGLLRDRAIQVETGVFGAAMEVTLVNDGPVTLILDVDRGRIG